MQKKTIVNWLIYFLDLIHCYGLQEINFHFLAFILHITIYITFECDALNTAHFRKVTPITILEYWNASIY